jgi:adenosylcobinamide-GDP ribazoletransferase
LRAHAETQPPRGEQATVERGRHKPPWRGLPSAITFLTIAPVPITAPDGLAVAAGWFPLVGAAIGALVGAVRIGAEHLLGRAPATVLALIALVIVTGALHQDGLADSADGIGARGGRARRLAVMRDPATGAFGALALIGWALLMFTTLASLQAGHTIIALIIACALGRWAALLQAATIPPARSEGLGAALHVSRPALAAATIVSTVLALGLGGIADGAIAIGAALCLAAVSAVVTQRNLGGHTGDTLGATVAITEVAACVALLAAWHG